MITIHQHPLSTFARRIRIALLEKGVEARFVDVDMGHKAHQAEPYLAINPYGRVPTLVDGDFVLIESTAILEYLEAKHPEPPLFPSASDARGRALAAMHVKLCDLEFSIHTRTLFFPTRFFPKEKWTLDEMEKAKAQIRAHLAILDGQFAGKTWAVNDAFGVVEVAYAPFVDFLPAFGITPPPQVAAWIARMQERPSVRATRLRR